MIDNEKELKELKELKEKLHTEMHKAKLLENIDELNRRLLSIEEKINKIQQNLEKYTNLSTSNVSNYVLQARQELAYAYGIAAKFADACKNIYDIAISIYDKQSNNKRSRKNSY